jgi:chemotaxis protein histidine kinase CheA
MTSVIFVPQLFRMAADQYQNIQQIIESLEKYSTALEKGELPLDELDEMVNLSRELYERMVVLRYKAFDQTVKAEEGQKPMNFRIGGTANIAKNQTSLIDAIDELESTEEEPVVEEVVETPQEPVIEETPEVVEEEPAKEAPVAEVEEVVAEEASQETSEEQSVNDKLQDQQPEETLAEKLERAPIDNLRNAIALNLKFQFIKELFDENSDDYNKAIDHIDTLSSSDEALEYTNKELASKQDWDMESEVVLQLIDLVERRFL